MNCKNCGTELSEGSVYCLKCGTKVEGTQPISGGAIIKAGGFFGKLSTLQKVLSIGGLVLILAFISYAVLSRGDNSNSTLTPKDTSGKSIPAATQPSQPAQITQPSQTTQTEQSSQAAQIPPATTQSSKNGFDKVTYNDGSYYEGNFVNGKRQGPGTYVSTKGIKYVGEFSDDKITGQFTVYFPSGDRYEGGLVSGARDGSGKYTYAQGGNYDGMWESDKKQGYGVYHFSNGDVYEGYYVNGLRQDANGKFSFASGESYIGGYSNDKINGQGTFYYTNGIYKGSFVNGQRDGYGRYEFESGNVYEGYWKNNKKSGQGTMYYSNGKKDFGTWENDVLVAAG